MSLSDQTLQKGIVFSSELHVVSTLPKNVLQADVSAFIQAVVSLGVPRSNIHFIVHKFRVGQICDHENWLAKLDLAPTTVWVDASPKLHRLWNAQNALQLARVPPEAWVVHLGVYERLVLPCSLGQIVAHLNEAQADFLQGPIVFTPTHSSAKALPQIPQDYLLPPTPALSRPENGENCFRVLIARGCIILRRGGYVVSERRTRKHCLSLMQQLASGVEDNEGARQSEKLVTRISRFGGRPFHHHRLSDVIGLESPEIRMGFPAQIQCPVAGDRRTSWIESESSLSEYGLVPVPVWFRQFKSLVRHRKHYVGHPRKPRLQAAACTDRWELRQITSGEGAGTWTAHSYYNLPIFNRSETQAVLYRGSIRYREVRLGDSVDIIVLDLETGTTSLLGETQAWSWQQGPMAQWTRDDRVIWNDRVDGRFVCREIDPRIPDQTRTLDRAVYALSPNGRDAASVDFGRVYLMRPAYGYAGAIAKEYPACPEDDGVWLTDLFSGCSRLALSIERAKTFVLKHLNAEDQASHTSARFSYWLDHPKFSPDGGQLTVKLRWKTKTSKFFGASVVLNTTTLTLEFIATETSHVIWRDENSLIYWSQRRSAMISVRREKGRFRKAPFLPGFFAANVHASFTNPNGDYLIFDTPYRPTVGLHRIRLSDGRVEDIARFSGHVPTVGAFRCDLHPVPLRAGNAALITSVASGSRQVWLAERSSAASYKSGR